MSPTPMEMGYVLVADRHAAFIKDYPNNSIETRMEYCTDTMVVMRCQLWKEKADRDSGKAPDGTGHAGMPIPGPTRFTQNSEVENAETSALGRALAIVGYHPKESFASKDEIDMKVDGESFRFPDWGAPAAIPGGSPVSDDRKATPAQIAKMMAWAKTIWAGADSPEKELQEFIKKSLGIYKKADLTRAHMSYLFDAFAALESKGTTKATE